MTATLHPEIRTTRPHAFSLTEVLVSLTIIGILAVLLLPMFGRMMSLAGSTECIQNLRQMHVYLTLYAQDHNGFYPAVRDSQTGYSWWLTLQNYENGPERPVGIDSPTIFLCPTALTTYPGGQAARTYAMNCEGVGDWRVPLHALRSVHAAQTLYIIDSAHNPAAAPGDGYFFFRVNGNPAFQSAVGARHNDKANGLFLDGHVEALDPNAPETIQYAENFAPGNF